MKKYGIIIITILINIIISIRLIDLMLFKHSFYYEQYKDITYNKIYGKTPLRGRILDVNGKVLVDNKIVKNYVFKSNVSINNLSDDIKKIATIIHYNKCSSIINKKKYYYYLNKNEIDNLVSEDMYNKYRLNKITYNDYMDYKYSLLTDEMIDNINDDEAIIYSILNNNYLYDDKIIYEDLNDLELSLLVEANLNNFYIDTSYKRIFNYETSLNEIFGSIGIIPKEKEEYYISKGYKKNDIVGISYLEEYYDDLLRGEKEIIYLDQFNNIIKEEKEKKGSDIVLNIDIDLQLQIETLLKNEMNNVLKYPSSKYYTGTYITLSDVQTGGVIALAGFKNVNKNLINDSLGTINNTYTVGSVVKAASQTVAYKNGVLDDKTKVYDSCVKLYFQPEKCSWKRLGILNDIDAIAYSSNYFQFMNAINVSNNKYFRNMKLDVNESDFNKYRDTFKLYGLGTKTGIDISNESEGLIGKKITGDLYLNLSIGQYDAYTPLMLNQYISTIANNGNRLALSLLKYSINSESIKENIHAPTVLNSVGLDPYYMDRLQKSLNAVIKYGTGTSYSNTDNMAGKTGTSETIFNGNNTLTRSFVAYFPYDEPKYAISIVSSNITYKNGVNSYTYPINNILSRKISNFMFEK